MTAPPGQQRDQAVRHGLEWQITNGSVGSDISGGNWSQGVERVASQRAGYARCGKSALGSRSLHT